VIRKGEGPKPSVSDKVRCHYQGTLINGKIFDSSIRRNEPATFAVSQVIPGWTEALQMMETGAKWRLFVPSGLAYGNQQAGEHIEPNSVLIFDVELLNIVK
jgi:FKBP-type peptidyl-prolyl cis-trans isomerase FklB